MKKNRSFVKCSICNQEIMEKHRFTTLAMHYGVICQECDKKFNDDEIELISNIFTAYGGYFSSRKGISENSSYQIIKNLSNLYKVSEKNIEVNSIDIKKIYQALFHGISTL